MSHINQSVSKWTYVARVLNDICFDFQPRLEPVEQHLVNYFEDGCDLVPEFMASVVSDLRELQMRAREGLDDLRKAGVIVSEPGAVTIHLPTFHDDDEQDDPLARRVAEFASPFQSLLGRLELIGRIGKNARAEVDGSKRYTRPESDLDRDVLSIEEGLLLIDALASMAIAKANTVSLS